MVVGLALVAGACTNTVNYRVLMRNQLGGLATLEGNRILVGDFNGDGRPDVAAPVTLSGPPDPGVKVLDPLGQAGGRTDRGLAILHGSTRKPGSGTPLERFLVLGVPPSDIRVRFRGPDPENRIPPPATRADTVLGDLGAANPGILYWNGTTYRAVELAR